MVTYLKKKDMEELVLLPDTERYLVDKISSFRDIVIEYWYPTPGAQ
jgi:hypothetical protein